MSPQSYIGEIGVGYGKDLRQVFTHRNILHDRGRYRIKNAGRAVAFDNPFGMGNERIRITKQTKHPLQHDQIGTSDVALLGNLAKSHLDDVHHGTHMRIDERQAGQFLLEGPQGDNALWVTSVLPA